MISLSQWLSMISAYEEIHITVVFIILRRRSSHRYVRMDIFDQPRCTKSIPLARRMALVSVYEGDANEPI